MLCKAQEIDEEYDEWPYVNGVSIKAKNNKNDKIKNAAIILSKIDEILTLMRDIVKISIQSISDIITNSSSEVFPVVAKYDIEDDLHEIIDAILDAGCSSFTSREFI